MWKQVRFNNGQIYGIIKSPLDEIPKTLVVTLAGLGQAMSEKNYMFSNLRKSLSIENVMVVQFDYMGHGDSYGELGDTSLKSMIRDAQSVINSVLKEYDTIEHLVLIGNSLGAVIAVNLSLLYENIIKNTPILISPPVNLPTCDEIFSKTVIEDLKKQGKLDSQILIPGYDYYTLSDFDKKQYEYVTKLGSHLLYLHGQCLSFQIIQEINEIHLSRELITLKSDVKIIIGEKDKETFLILNNLSKKELFLLDNVHYYHQHPAAMDQLIYYLNEIIMSINNK
ncbi:alpha/beta hydrolase [Bacillus sp. 166amftsu]|uniref:serine aminopeptidase domain-containing protein n=1 Tax=Bacillus sp. 166amftsu TaxID=1761753 RepID=UPI00089668B3|nr:alpha/beta hydrolase [Bacillus sp. 166amftsu]SDZ37840.1 Serine aminopeptidase, S33 [Bacillus sp. 166amftsu]